MSLRRKTLFCAVLTLVGLLAAMTLSSSHVLLRGFAAVEQDLISQKMLATREAILREQNRLNSAAADWAPWDEMYQFTLTGDDGFISRNLADDAIRNLNLGLIIVLRADGTVAYETGFDADSGTKKALPAGFSQRVVAECSALGMLRATNGRSGIVLLPAGAALVAAQPITTSARQGPVGGTLVFGRLIDHAFADGIARVTREQIELIAYNHHPLPPACQLMLAAAPSSAGLHMRASRELLSAISLMNDARGRPCLIIRVDLPRDVYAQGLASLWSLVIWMLAAGLSFGLVLLWVIERFVVDPVRTLAFAVNRVRTTGDTSTRMPTDNQDEVGLLARELNRLLDSVDRSNAEIRRINEALESRVHDRTREIEAANAELLRDIAERKRVERQLSIQTAALAAAANGIVITSAQGEIVWANEAFSRLTGYALDECIGQNLRILRSGRHDADFYRAMWETILSGQTWHGELTNRRKGGSLYTEEMTITPVRDEHGMIVHFVAIKQDVSERKQLQQQLLQAQKMESIGRLAGGIAHDFNNLLQAIIGFGEILRKSMKADDPRTRDVDEIDTAARRAAALTRQLLAFSRKQMIEPRILDLNTVITDMAGLLRRTIGEDIELIADLESDIARTRADVSQIEQALMNLVVNARDAMPDGGRLTISTSNMRLEEQDTAAIPESHAGDFVCLAVSDSGAGMTPDVLEHLFEPFFTTKGLGKGTGLGLAMVYGMAKQHEGWVHVYSQVGQGSTFKIYLPAFSTSPAPDAAFGALEGEPSVAGSGERILVVEDEPGVRALAANILQDHGFTVTTAGTVQEALALIEAGPPFHILFTDVVLPDRTGVELAEFVERQSPATRIMLTSGYTDEKARWPVIQARGWKFLQKPFPSAALLRLVHELLSGPEPARPSGAPPEAPPVP